MMSKVDIFAEDSSSVNTPLRGSPVIGSNNFPTASPDKPQATKISLDQIASTLLKQNFILTALEFHTELAETGRELPRLRDFFSNPANFEQQQQFSNTNTYSYNGSIGGGGGSGFYPLHKASSIQTFDSLDLTRYSDDVGESKFDDKIAVLEFELRKAKETIHQLRNTLTLATDSSSKILKKDPESAGLNHKHSNSSEDSNTDDYDPVEIKNSETFMSFKETDNQNLKHVMPHEKNAINFLINEYLLEQDYKMTSVTFSEENESQDLEDWDVIGLNRAKPPNLCQIYKLFLNKNIDESLKSSSAQPMLLSKQTSINGFEDRFTDIEIQVDLSPDTDAKETNTEIILSKSFECFVNFDQDQFENQRLQIAKLIEKQEILVKSLANLETEKNLLNVEREANLRKIDLLHISLDESNSTVKILQKKGQEESVQKDEVSCNLNGDKEFIEKIGNNEQPSNDAQLTEVKKIEPNERKIPVVFRNYLHKYSMTEFDERNDQILKEIAQLKLNRDTVIELLFKYLPIIAPNVVIEQRLSLLPLVFAGAVLEQEDTCVNQKDYPILKLLFNLIENPNAQQRSTILATCIQFTKHVGPMCVNNYLLPQCWEQINHKSEERRMLVAEACSILAPHIHTEMRSSLMFSILKEIIEQEKSEQVRVSAAKSLSILINYIKDEQKFNQCIELLDICTTDSSLLVISQVEKLMMPSLSLWALMIGKFNEPFMSHLLEKTELHLLNKQSRHVKTYLNLLHMNLQFVFASVLMHFRDNETETTKMNEVDNQLSKLNNYYHKLQEKMNLQIELYKLDSYLDDYLKLTKKYLLIIEDDSWSSDALSNAFSWLNNKFLRSLIQMSAQIDARDSLCPYFVKFFSDFVLLFTIDFDFIKSEIIPIFERLLNVPDIESEDIQNAFEQSLKNKSCPLYKATLPVYFVGILSTLVDVEINGWFNIIQDSKNTELSASNSIQFNQIAEANVENKSNDKRLQHMNDYLKNVFIALSLNQTNLDGLIVIYELMKLKSKSSDYIIQMLISTLWDGIVHMSLYVRCNTAKLFEILVKDCDENLLSTRILPALITLANDLDKMVRCSSISPLTCIIEYCSNKEILERVYTQLQSFLSDPILKDEYLLQIELLKTFRRISTKSNTKFREEFILPYLTILTMQIKNVINDNDYEFPLSAVTLTYPKIASLSSASLMSLSSSTLSQSSTTKMNDHQHHQQDVLKICILLYDTYKKLCTTQDDSNIVYISRQSLQESLLPGLVCLKEIFQNNVISPTSSNEFVSQLESIISKIEKMQISSTSISQDSPLPKHPHSVNSTPILPQEPISSTTPATPFSSSSSPQVQALLSATSITSQAASTVGDFVNASVTAIASPITTNNSTTSTDNANFKSFVFKGINTFKDQSKDKFSNFMQAKNTPKK